MKHKILVITAGTVAAGVGKEFLKQVALHPHSELQPTVRYIDTAYLPTRYSGLRDGEWLQMTIDPRFIDSIRRDTNSYPHLRKLFYPGLYPQIQGSGGGSIRYNAAGAVAIGRERLKQWIHTSITDLIRAGGGEVRLSIALVVSSVGATGSGTLERLVDLIVDAANEANIPPPIHIDTFILQPSMQGVTDLGLANTLALYAEMAASRLAKRQIGNANKSYRGRTLMVGWGSERYLSSIDQLKEAAAALIRFAHDPSTDIAAEFQEREVDNHVLRELDTRTHLPSHLSSATAVTISLGDLEEKIIQRDADILLESIVLGKQGNGDSPEAFAIPGSKAEDVQSGTLQDALIKFLEGSTPEARYQHLLNRLAEVIDLQSLQLSASQFEGLSAVDQANQLRSIWQSDKDQTSQLDRKKIQVEGSRLISDALNAIKLTRRERLSTGLTLLGLRDEYQRMQAMLSQVLRVAQDISRNARLGQNLAQISTDDEEVKQRLAALQKAWRFSRTAALEQAIVSVQNDIQTRLRREMFAVGLEMLKELTKHCAQVILNLDVVIPRVRQVRTDRQKQAPEELLHIEMNHPLQLAALASHDEIMRFANRVSMFPTDDTNQAGILSRLIMGDDTESDPLAGFRKWLQDQRKQELLVDGKLEPLMEATKEYATRHFFSQMEDQELSVIDVLLQAGDDILVQRLRQAAAKAHSLVSFSTDFATERREARHVSAKFRPEQYSRIQAAIDSAFGEGLCTLISSKDPTEIGVFYYVDGLAMAAVSDLAGRCLSAFLRRRESWHQQAEKEVETSLNGNSLDGNGEYNQKVGVPIYSSRDAQERVFRTDVIRLLYNVRGQSVDDESIWDIPELSDNTKNQAGQAQEQNFQPPPGNPSNGHGPVSSGSGGMQPATPSAHAGQATNGNITSPLDSKGEGSSGT